MYGVKYAVVRNIARWEAFWQEPKTERYFIYQGAVNEGRSFETLIPAMKQVPIPLYICGDGNFMAQAQALVKEHGLEDRVIFKGLVPPAALRELTRQAFAGVTLFDPRGKSNYYSLANRFFDYIHAYIPQICVDYPVYREINETHRIAMLVPNTDKQTLADALNNLLVQAVVYETLRGNCIRAAQVLNWQQEEQVLLEFYQNLERLMANKNE
jgi:glycosyltransferase involved in cell wall biosynthesis